MTPQERKAAQRRREAAGLRLVKISGFPSREVDLPTALKLNDLAKANEEKRDRPE